MQIFARILALAAVPLVGVIGSLAAQTDQPPDFDPVHPVAADETWIELRGFPLAKLAGLSHLQRRPIGEVVREVWRWETGRRSVAGAIVPNARIEGSLSDPAGRRAQIGLWSELRQSGFEFRRDEIKTGNNALGMYFYVVSDRTNTGTVCLYFRQGMPVIYQGAVAVDEDAIRGEISGYDCRDGGAVSPAALEQAVRPMLDAIAFR